jgi:hypothetical protein
MKAAYAQVGQTPVLLELYSSEGCDNCPLADKFMKEVLRIADSTQSPVHVIDFHVDLWDRSGWVDVYADSVHTSRLIKHALMNEQRAIFTPMLFVNGKGAIPGSAKKQAGALIAMELMAPQFVSIQSKALLSENGKKLSIDYQASRYIDSCEVHIALIKKQITTHVTAGDNAGKTLTHHNVVMKFKSEKLNNDVSGKITWDLKTPITTTDYKVMVFVQSLTNSKVFAVDEISIVGN